jgi:hypothetical protein
MSNTGEWVIDGEETGRIVVVALLLADHGGSNMKNQGHASSWATPWHIRVLRLITGRLATGSGRHKTYTA